MSTTTAPAETPLEQTAPAAAPTARTKHITPEKDRVRLFEKMSLGFGGMTEFFGNVGVQNIAIPVYQMTLGINPALLGIALALPRFWDALTDPVMGNISDNCRSRFGRRKPFIVLGAILMAISFGIIWMVPTGWSETAQLTYFIITSLVFFTCYTVWSVPFTSLTYEMTPDYRERTRVMAYPTFFSKLGEAGYTWVVPLASIAAFGTFMVGIRWVGWGVAIVILGLLGLLPGLLVRERFVRKAVVQKTDHIRFLPTFMQSMRSTAFRVLIALTLLQVLTGMLASSLDYYLLVYYMFDGDIKEGSVWKGALSTGYAVVGFVSIFFVSFLASRFEKRTVLSSVYTLVAVGGIVKWFVFTPGNPWLIMIDPLFGGIVWVAIGMVMPSMLADICDEDELHSGQRREGMYGAIFSWIRKTGVSLAAFGSGLALVAIGFNEELGGDQDPRTIFYMRLILAGSTTAIALLAIFALRFYPITEQTAAKTRAVLESRRGEVHAQENDDS